MSWGTFLPSRGVSLQDRSGWAIAPTRALLWRGGGRIVALGRNGEAWDGLWNAVWLQKEGAQPGAGSVSRPRGRKERFPGSRPLGTYEKKPQAV